MMGGYMQSPKVSIITPSFNQARFLPQTLRSVREQDYPNIEHILVDGGSTDGTIELLKGVSGLRWVSEPDNGQVDALNKGFAMATGEILAWLNSDDTLSPGAARLAVEALQRTGADLVYGDVRLIDEGGTHLRMSYGIPFDYRILLCGIDYIGQQSVFFRRTLLDKAGLLRAEFDNAFDYELWLRMAQHGRLVYVPEIRGCIRKHAGAKSIALARRTHDETKKLRSEYWKTGGLPRFLAWPAHWYYRWKRLRKVALSNSHPRLLTFGYLPPPIYGPAITYQALLRSSFTERFDVTFVNLNVVRDFRELQVFRWRKLILLGRHIGEELWHLLTQRFDFVFYPISINRNAFLKDALLLAIARWFHVPVVIYGHGNNLPEFRDKSPRWLQRIIDRTLGRAVAATVPGKALRFNFLGHLREDQVFAVPNGIEVPAKLPPVTKPPGRFTVLYLGNLVREKGVFVLLDAIPTVRAHCPEAHFIFAGAWWREDDRVEAERLVRDRGLSSCVEFTGMVTGNRKWEVVAQSDVLVFATFYHYETFGQVLLEAMGAGLPVIATRRAAIPEIVEEGVNGLFVAEQDARDLADKIITLAADPALRARMGEANRRKYESFYTVEHYGKRMAAVFDELLRSTRKTA
jgi:glycosyltransferase involved in cell wall biosynthesis/GT2 family glycosyltransferase